MKRSSSAASTTSESEKKFKYGKVVVVCYVDHRSASTSIYRIPAELVSGSERKALASFNNTAPWGQEDRDEKDKRITSMWLLTDSVAIWPDDRVPEIVAWARKQKGGAPLGADEENPEEFIPWKYLHDMLTEGKWAEFELERKPGDELFDDKSGELVALYHIIKSGAD